MAEKVKRIDVKSKLKNNSAMVIMIMMLILGTVLYSNFMSLMNITNVLRQVSFTGIIAAGMTFVILTGGIDLSVGSVFAFASVLSSFLQGMPVPVIAFIIIAAGAAMGTINGAIVAYLNIAPFIVTLATMMGYRGICYLLTDGGVTRNISNEAFSVLGRGYIAELIPLPVVFLAIVIAVASVILKYTAYGRSVYAVGGNEEAAKMMAVNLKQIKMLVYTISGICSAIGGMLMAARMSSGEPVAGQGYEMTAISAVVLGGTLLSGGKGSMKGTVFGVIVLGLINNMMNMQGNMSVQMQNVIMGVLLLLIVIMQSGMNRAK